MPKYKRIDQFKGIQIHLHVYQEPTNYKNKHIVVVRYENRSIEFVDKTKIEDIDAVIYATGYQIEFLFLDRHRTKIKDIDTVIYATGYQIEFPFLDRAFYSNSELCPTCPICHAQSSIPDNRIKTPIESTSNNNQESNKINEDENDHIKSEDESKEDEDRNNYNKDDNKSRDESEDNEKGDEDYNNENDEDYNNKNDENYNEYNDNIIDDNNRLINIKKLIEEIGGEINDESEMNIEEGSSQISAKTLA
ncbi:12929_t:CDS:2, partial [Racocetra persica]